VSAGAQGQGGRRAQAQRGAESGFAASASSSASRPAPRAPTAALSSFPAARDARVLALLERIASGVEGLRDELRGVAALATLAQDARALPGGRTRQPRSTPSGSPQAAPRPRSARRLASC
jgi:hypothetical protein